jgi:hypothetical protein
VEELEKRREESLKLLTDYAMDRSDEKTIAAQVADATTIALPVVKPEPEAGLSVDVKVSKEKSHKFRVSHYFSSGRDFGGDAAEAAACGV